MAKKRFFSYGMFGGSEYMRAMTNWPSNVFHKRPPKPKCNALPGQPIKGVNRKPTDRATGGV